MTSTALPATIAQIEERVASVVREGLTAQPKWLAPWLFYDKAGSILFDQITELPEYYLTRTERAILAAHAGAMIGSAADGRRLRMAELGAGSADKTRLLLAAAAAHQGEVLYEPIDVSATALEAARERIEREIPGVSVAPQVADYTRGLQLDPAGEDERRLVLYIGSSIGNFEPQDAAHLLKGVRAGLRPGEGLLLGVDLVKDEKTLLAAYDDAAGVTTAFNRNLLRRLNRELGADFDLDCFTHRAVWNPVESRIEMHLVSDRAQRVRFPALDMTVEFDRGESIHTENSYKYRPEKVQSLLEEAGFSPAARWTDEQGWFSVMLGRAIAAS